MFLAQGLPAGSSSKRRPCILLTGFGPFPGTRCNPTGSLVEGLARMRRPALADAELVAHVFPTQYEAVDRDLPTLVARHRPDGILMFGLAPRAKHVRVEIQACNAIARTPDKSGRCLGGHAIVAGGPARANTTAPVVRLLQAARSGGLKAALSRDAGRYLCNYIYWRALEAGGGNGGPKLAAFVHVPPLRRAGRRRGLRNSTAPTAAALRQTAQAILVAMLAALKDKK
jgi:pyroglutamyl-peptidase